MSLKDLTAPTKTVTDSQGNKHVLRPLMLHDLADLLKNYKSELEEVFNSREGGFSWERIIPLAPDLATIIIAMSMREPELVDIVKKEMLLGDQINMLYQITLLTIPDDEQFADFFLRGVQAIPRLVGSLDLGPSKSQMLPSEKKRSSIVLSGKSERRSKKDNH